MSCSSLPVRLHAGIPAGCGVDWNVVEKHHNLRARCFRGCTDVLDKVGNSIAVIGKGFAIGFIQVESE